MERQEYDNLFEKVKTAVTTCGRCDECPYGGENNKCPKQLHRDVRTLIDAFDEQMQAVIAEKSDIARKVIAIEDERMYLEKRLKHLLQSETIRQFDAISPRGGDYERDIAELDEMIKGSAQKEAIDALFKKIAKNCENELSVDEIKKYAECFDHLRQVCKGLFTKMY